MRINSKAGDIMIVVVGCCKTYMSASERSRKVELKKKRRPRLCSGSNAAAYRRTDLDAKSCRRFLHTNYSSLRKKSSWQGKAIQRGF